MKSQKKINLNVVILSVLILGLGLIARKETKFRETHQSNFVSHVPKLNAQIAVPAKVVQAKPERGLEQVETNLRAYMKLEEGGSNNLSRLSAKREKLLKNASLLRNLRVFLSRSPIDAQEAAEQNAGFALLLQAAHGEQSETATETLRMIVADQELDDALAEGRDVDGRHIQSEDEEVIGYNPRFLRDKLRSVNEIKPLHESAASLGQ